jgi:DNA-binding GntR family transcriptional regulator
MRSLSDGDANQPGPGSGEVGAEVLGAVRSLTIERSTTAERVADGLRELIIYGDLPPGTPLREPVLVDALGVSRNTLREAFRLLSRDGLVVHQMHRGVEVRQLTRADVSDIYRARRGLEITAIQHSAGVPDHRLESLRAAVTSADVARKARDWKSVGTYDLVFHRQIVAMIGSRRIDNFFESVLAELRLAFAMASDQEALFSPYVSRNHNICGMLERGERGACVKEMRRYLSESEQHISSFLADGAQLAEGSGVVAP